MELWGVRRVEADVSWTTQKVALKFHDGSFPQVDGLVHADAPGLAVTPYLLIDGQPTGQYAVTHIPTGYRLIEALRYKKTAKAFCLSIAGLTDWASKTVGITPDLESAVRGKWDECANE